MCAQRGWFGTPLTHPSSRSWSVPNFIVIGPSVQSIAAVLTTVTGLCAVACVQWRWAGLEAAAAAAGGGGDAGRADGSCHGRVETVATVTG